MGSRNLGGTASDAIANGRHPVRTHVHVLRGCAALGTAEDAGRFTAEEAVRFAFETGQKG